MREASTCERSAERVAFDSNSSLSVGATRALDLKRSSRSRFGDRWSAKAEAWLVLTPPAHPDEYQNAAAAARYQRCRESASRRAAGAPASPRQGAPGTSSSDGYKDSTKWPVYPRVVRSGCTRRSRQLHLKYNSPPMIAKRIHRVGWSKGVWAVDGAAVSMARRDSCADAWTVRKEGGAAWNVSSSRTTKQRSPRPCPD